MVKIKNQRGLILNKKLNTATDLDFLLLGYNIENPQIVTYKEEILGRDGLLDLSEAVDGLTHYNNRILIFNFFVTATSKRELINKIDLINEYHGKYIDNIVNSDDDNYYYKGRCSVNVTEQKSLYAYITIEFDAQPYKYKKNKTVIIKNLEIGEYDIELRNECMPSVVDINFSGTAVFDDLKTLTKRKTNFHVNVTKSGTLIVSYQEGRI